MTGMHMAHGWAELGFVDHSEDFASEPPKTQTDFKHQCLCREITVDGETFMAYSPACERPGHGCRSRLTSEFTTDSANPIRLGRHPTRGGA